MARCYYDSDDFHRSLYYLDLAIKKENNGQYLTLKGNSLYRLGRFEQSALSFQEALKLEPGNSWASVNLGLAFFSQGKIAEAEKLWISVEDKTVKNHPTFLLALYRLALVKQDSAAIISCFENMPEIHKNKFEWKYPYIKEVIAVKNDEEKKNIFNELRNLAGNDAKFLSDLQSLEKLYPTREVASQK